MITPDQIPDAVVEAALKKRGLMREAIADALNAWPGVRMMVDIDTGDDSALKLPLPQQEGSDDA